MKLTDELLRELDYAILCADSKEDKEVYCSASWLEIVRDEMNKLKEENDRVNDQLQDALSTLKWYADEENHEDDGDESGRKPEIWWDGGKRAQQAVERIKEEFKWQSTDTTNQTTVNEEQLRTEK